MIAIPYLLLLVLAVLNQYVLCDPSPLIIELGSAQAHREPHQLLRRGPISASTLTFSNRAWAYIDASIGSPGQAMRLALSSSLSDITVVSNQAGICGDRTCDAGATFNKQFSSTFKDLNNTFYQQLGDGTQSTGRVVKDSVKISGQPFDNMTMLLAIGGNLTCKIQTLRYSKYSSNRATRFNTWFRLCRW